MEEEKREVKSTSQFWNEWLGILVTEIGTTEEGDGLKREDHNFISVKLVNIHEELLAY